MGLKIMGLSAQGLYIPAPTRILGYGAEDNENDLSSYTEEDGVYSE